MARLFNIPLIILIALFFGCKSAPEVSEKPGLFSLEPYKAEHDLAGSQEYNLGISLSGGGLRSSLFGYGALKALYDAGILQSVDVISSVSGGGYTAYALFTSEDESYFGESIFHPDQYMEETCKLITSVNFINPLSVFSRGLSISPTSGATYFYERSIRRTYGRGDEEDLPMKIGTLTQAVSQNSKPFWIINATIGSPASTTWRDRLFEFTPLWIGNDTYGYTKFSGSESPELKKAIAISGAAFAPLLEQEIAVQLPNYEGSLTLSDGGHSENLGAIALIKRGVKNIIIIDAEHDPNYSFGAYFKLKSKLSAFDSDFEIEEIEKVVSSGGRLENGLYEGMVRTRFTEEERISRIYYLKMGMPKSLEGLLLNSELKDRGRLTSAEYFATLKEHQDAAGNWDCSTVKSFDADLEAWYAHSVSEYAVYLNNESYVRLADKLPGDFFTSKFPQYTTIDQSFYLDQALAFIGLGYLEAQEIVQRSDMKTLSEGLQDANP